MAKATKDVEREVIEKTTVTLVLSGDEARALLMLTARVGGDAATTVRKQTNAVFAALADSGVQYNYREAQRAFTGSLVAEGA